MPLILVFPLALYLSRVFLGPVLNILHGRHHQLHWITHFAVAAIATTGTWATRKYDLGFEMGEGSVLFVIILIPLRTFIRVLVGNFFHPLSTAIFSLVFTIAITLSYVPNPTELIQTLVAAGLLGILGIAVSWLLKQHANRGQKPGRAISPAAALNPHPDGPNSTR